MNKKGFTLIELLAVIVILGIIMLIAIPAVSNVMKSSKEKTEIINAKSFLSEVEKYVTMHDLDPGTYTIDLKNKTMTIDGKTFTIDGDDSSHSVADTFKLSGNLPTSGTVTINKNGKVEKTNIVYDENTYEYSKDGGLKLIRYVKFDTGEIVYYNPVNNEVCTKTDYETNTDASTTGNKTGCMLWYAFLDKASSSKVKLLSDHNTTLTVNSNPTLINAEVETLNSEWDVITRLISANEVAQIVGADKALNWTYSSTFSPFYFDGAYGSDDTWQTQVSNSKNKSHFAWLYNNTYICTGFGCEKADNADNRYWNGGWFAHYFTSDYYVAYNAAKIYAVVLNNGSLANCGNNGAIRPVVEVNKSIFE